MDSLQPRVAVIVPALDEEEALGQNLAASLELADELVVSDGGSQDGSVELAQSFGARVVSSSPGRGPQLNTGARQTTAEILLFLHADTRLPEEAVDAVRKAIASGCIGGGFLLEFDDRRPILRLGGRLVNIRTRLIRAPLGDQAQFVTREIYDELGGFRDWPFLEDVDFIGRLKRAGRIAVLPHKVTTSGRRFTQRGTVRTVTTNWLIWALYFAGISPYRLATLYKKVR